MPQPVTFSEFRGDWAALAHLIKTSWGENKEGSLDYTPEFLRSCYEYPGVETSLSPTLYSDDEPIAFIAGFPRNLEWNGQPSKMLLSSLLTAAPEAKRKGYGAWLWMDLAKRARAAGYDAMISLCVNGGDVNRLVEACSRMLRFPTAQIATVSYMTRMLGSTQTEAARPNPTDVDLFLELAPKATGDVPFRRVWTKAEAQWQCCDRYGATTVVHRGPDRRGILTGYVIETLGSPATRLLVVEDLFWHELSSEERKDLLTSMMNQGAARGARIASVPLMGYTSVETFQALRFRPSPRKMNVHITQWSGPAAAPVDSVYLDIL